MKEGLGKMEGGAKSSKETSQTRSFRHKRNNRLKLNNHISYNL
jgi:hypothetical protein